MSSLNHDHETLHDRDTEGQTMSLQSPPAPKDEKVRNMHMDSEVTLIDWNGPDDPQNPKNWSYKKRWAATIMVSLFTFISPLASSMMAPATANIASEFGITNSAEAALVTSIFILAYAVGPLVLGPLSEIYGRVRVIQGCNLFFFVWNLACGFSQSAPQIIVFRFFSGLGGSAPLAVGAGCLADIWRPEERGRAIAIYSLAPLLGPTIGPIAGAWIAQRTTWRWVFWSTSIFAISLQIPGLFFLKESFAPFLLDQKADRMNKTASGDAEKGRRVYRSVMTSEDRHWKKIFAKAMVRPWILMGHEPIVQLVGIYMALLYGIFYLFLTTIPRIFAKGSVYDEEPGIAGLHYLALGIGLTIGSQGNARVIDRLYTWLKNRNNGVGEPEFRVPSMLPGAIIMPLGLLLSGWAAQNHLHWAVTDVGMGLVGCGMILGFQSMQTYIIDAFTLHAASALAAVSCLRSLFGFAFPLFAPKMYDALGYGKGNTILAVIAFVVGVPSPIIFWKYGKAIREKSKHAKK